jgi:hypothetical protein
MSAGCHVLIRAGEAVLVTDVTEAASSLLPGLAGDDGVQSG